MRLSYFLCQDKSRISEGYVDRFTKSNFVTKLLFRTIYNNMAKIIADKSHFIVVGAWNPAILQADWLTNEFPEITPSPLCVEIEVQTNNIRFDFSDFYLLPSNNRLVFIPKNNVDDTVLSRISILAKGIYDRLKFTPLGAVGSNFFFQLEKNEVFTSSEIEREPVIKNLPDKLANASIISRSIKHTLSESDFNTNIMYDIVGVERSLLINFEYQNSQNIMDIATNSLIDNFGCAIKLANNLVETL